MTDERDGRESRTAAVLAWFLAHPSAWIGVRRLADIGGFAAWRTRVSDARQIVSDRGLGRIVWNEDSKDSQYRYLPAPPVVRQPTVQLPLFEAGRR